jgi:hypothetical protein
MNELMSEFGHRYADARLNAPYATGSRQTCDIVIPRAKDVWWVEAKLLRLLGDNGKANDNMLMHILSPYPDHRSALTDCRKLSTCEGRAAILIFGYDSDTWPLDLAIDAFEALASAAKHRLTPRVTTRFADLIHPVHRSGRVFGWEILG